MEKALRHSTASQTLADFIALTKPRITLMVLVTAAGGMWLAPGAIDLGVAVTMLLTTAMVVGGANSLNCYLERDSDRLMTRTAKRPLPDGRMEPQWALYFGIALGVVSVPLLSVHVNPLTGLLGLVSLVSYVAVYTPMKRMTPGALLVGAIPGAMPPLMGWTAVTGEIGLPGVVLFMILFIWQIPHFIAISIFRQEEYERAGLKVLPSVRGLDVAKRHAFAYTVVLAFTSFLLYPLNVAGPIYLAFAVVLGAWFSAVGFIGLSKDAGKVWAKRFFFTSLIYLTVLFTVLMFDAA